MAVTKRSVKGSELTMAEIDANWDELIGLLTRLGTFVASQTPGANQIPVMSASGNFVLPTGNIGLGVSPTFDFIGKGMEISSNTSSVSLKLTNTTTGTGAGNGLDIGVDSGGNGYLFNRENAALIFGANNGEAGRFGASGNFLPGADNSRTCGQSDRRWSVVYAGTGSINTSDAREKTGITSLTVYELAAAKDLAKEMGTYQFLSAVATKGLSARHHVGMTVQRAIDIMQSHGLDPYKYSFICYDEWPEQIVEHPQETSSILDQYNNTVVTKEAWIETIPAGNRYSSRPDELLMFIARGLEARLTALEARLLEGK